MNDRIQKIIQESGLYVAYDNKAVTDKELEYFAELIVQECITVINSENHREHTKGWNDAIEWAQGSIEDHFGVEE